MFQVKRSSSNCQPMRGQKKLAFFLKNLVTIALYLNSINFNLINL
jgi:hypothetical protein